MTFYDGVRDRKRKKADNELMLLKKPNKVNAWLSRVPKPKEALPSNPLPAWKNLTLDQKVPAPPAADGTFVISRNIIGEKIFSDIPDQAFDNEDPYMYETPTSYEPLHDPHLKEFFQLHPNIVEQLLNINLLTSDGAVYCRLSELNKYRIYLSRVHKKLINAEREREGNWQQFEKDQLEKIRKWFYDQAKKLRDEELKRRRLKIKEDYENRMMLVKRKHREHPSNEIKELRARENINRKFKRDYKRRVVANRIAKMRYSERKRIQNLILKWVCEEHHADMLRDFYQKKNFDERQLNLKDFIDTKRKFQERKLRHHKALLKRDKIERDCKINRRQDYYNRREMEMREEAYLREEKRQRREERIYYLMLKYGRRWLALTRRNHHDGLHDSSWHIRKNLQDSGVYLKEMSGAKSFTSFLAAILQPKKKRDVWENVETETKHAVNSIMRDLMRNTYNEILVRTTGCLVDFVVEEARKLCLTHVCDEGLDPADLEEPIIPVRKKIKLPRSPPLWPCSGPCAEFGHIKGGADWKNKCTKMAEALGDLHEELTDQLTRKLKDNMDSLFPDDLGLRNESMRDKIDSAKDTDEMEEATRTVAGIAMDRASDQPADDDMQDDFREVAIDRLAESLDAKDKHKKGQKELDGRYALAKELVDAEMGGQLDMANEKRDKLLKALGLENVSEEEEEDGIGSLIAQVLEEQRKKMQNERREIGALDNQELTGITDLDERNVDRVSSDLVQNILCDDDVEGSDTSKVQESDVDQEQTVSPTGKAGIGSSSKPGDKSKNGGSRSPGTVQTRKEPQDKSSLGGPGVASLTQSGVNRRTSEVQKSDTSQEKTYRAQPSKSKDKSEIGGSRAQVTEKTNEQPYEKLSSRGPGDASLTQFGVNRRTSEVKKSGVSHKEVSGAQPSKSKDKSESGGNRTPGTEKASDQKPIDKLSSGGPDESSLTQSRVNRRTSEVQKSDASFKEQTSGAQPSKSKDKLEMDGSRTPRTEKTSEQQPRDKSSSGGPEYASLTQSGVSRRTSEEKTSGAQPSKSKDKSEIGGSRTPGTEKTSEQQPRDKSSSGGPEYASLTQSGVSRRTSEEKTSGAQPSKSKDKSEIGGSRTPRTEKTSEQQPRDKSSLTQSGVNRRTSEVQKSDTSHKQQTYSESRDKSEIGGSPIQVTEETSEQPNDNLSSSEPEVVSLIQFGVNRRTSESYASDREQRPEAHPSKSKDKSETGGSREPETEQAIEQPYDKSSSGGPDDASLTQSGVNRRTSDVQKSHPSHKELTPGAQPSKSKDKSEKEDVTGVGGIAVTSEQQHESSSGGTDVSLIQSGMNRRISEMQKSDALRMDSTSKSMDKLKKEDGTRVPTEGMSSEQRTEIDRIGTESAIEGFEKILSSPQASPSGVQDGGAAAKNVESDEVLSDRISELNRLVVEEQRREVQREADVARAGDESLIEDTLTEGNISRISSALAVRAICDKTKGTENLQSELCGEAEPEVDAEALVLEGISSQPDPISQGLRLTQTQSLQNEGVVELPSSGTGLTPDVQVLLQPSGDNQEEPSQVPSINPLQQERGALRNNQATDGTRPQHSSASGMTLGVEPSDWYEHPNIPHQSFFDLPSTAPSGFRYMLKPQDVSHTGGTSVPFTESEINQMALGIQESDASYMDPGYHHLHQVEGHSEVHQGGRTTFPSAFDGLVPLVSTRAIHDSNQQPMSGTGGNESEILENEERTTATGMTSVQRTETDRNGTESAAEGFEKALSSAQARLSSIQDRRAAAEKLESDEVLGDRVSQLIRLVVEEQRREVQRETDVVRADDDSLIEETLTEGNLSRIASAMAVKAICDKFKSMQSLQNRLCGDAEPELTSSLEALVREYISSQPDLILHGLTRAQCPPSGDVKLATESRTHFSPDIQILLYPNDGNQQEPSQAPSISPSRHDAGAYINNQRAYATPTQHSSASAMTLGMEPSNWYEHPNIPNENFFHLPSNAPSDFRFVLKPQNNVSTISRTNPPITQSELNRMSVDVQESVNSYTDPAYHPLQYAEGESEVHRAGRTTFPITKSQFGPPPSSSAILDSNQQSMSLQYSKIGPSGMLTPEEIQEIHSLHAAGELAPDVRINIRDHLREIRIKLDEIKRALTENRADFPSPPK